MAAGQLGETIGIGVIGVGIRGQHAYEVFLARRPDCRVVAVAQQPDPIPELLEGKDPEDCARQWAENLGADYARDWREVIARDDVQVVSLMCDAAASPALVEAAAAAGKHIVRDKFLATDVAGARRAAAACRAAGVEMLVTYNLRYTAGVRQVIEQVRGGVVGRPLAATAVYLVGEGPLEGFVATDAYRRAMGGGELTTFGVYAVDVLLEIFGSLPETVFCSAGAFFYPDYRAAALEDMAQVTFQFADGRVAYFVVGRTTTAPAPECYFRLEVTSERGWIGARAAEPAARLCRDGCHQLPWRPSGAVEDMLDDFICRLRSSEPSPIPAERGVEVLQIIRAAYASAARGEPADVSESA